MNNTTLRLPPHRSPVPTRTRLRTRRLPIPAYIAVLLVLPLAVLLAGRVSGWWVTTGHTVPATALGAGVPDTTAAGTPRTPDGSVGTGMSAHDVTGSMTLAQLVAAFPTVTAAQVCERFGAPADTPPSTQLKTLAKNGNGFDVSDLRGWLEERQTSP